MDYGLWFFLYRVRIKPERKCVGFRLLLGLFLIWLIPMLSDYTSVLREFGQCLVLFYNHFHYRIYFNGFRYEIRF